MNIRSLKFSKVNPIEFETIHTLNNCLNHHIYSLSYELLIKINFEFLHQFYLLIQYFDSLIYFHFALLMHHLLKLPYFTSLYFFKDHIFTKPNRYFGVYSY